MKTLSEPSNKQFWLAVFLVVFGCLMLLAAFIVDPTGEIHGSVLTAFGEILSFAGAVLGFDYYNRKTFVRLQRNRPANDKTEEDKQDES